MKICSKCKESKEEFSFIKSKQTKDGLYAWCKSCYKEWRNCWKINNKDKIAVSDKKYRINNKNKVKEGKKLYYQNNKSKVNESYKLRKLNDLNFKLKTNLRIRLNKAVKNGQKVGSAVEDLGCSIHEFKVYIQNLFQPGMTWENYGNKEEQWSFDHIVPLSKFNLANREDFLKACHYTNIQPMWHNENVLKGNR